MQKKKKKITITLTSFKKKLLSINDSHTYPQANTFLIYILKEFDDSRVQGNYFNENSRERRWNFVVLFYNRTNGILYKNGLYKGLKQTYV